MTAAFFDVPRAVFQTSTASVELPILYYDVAALNAFFAVETERAREKLAGTELLPLRMPGGKTPVGLAWFEYRETSIGAYNEVGVAIGCYHRAEPKQPGVLLDFRLPAARRGGGFHIIDLPVTTQAAYTAGRELWGYPKFVTKIPLTFSPRRFDGAVLDPETSETLVSLSGAMSLGPVVPGIDLVLFSEKAGRTIKTTIDIDAKMRTALPRGMRLEVGPSQHRMAQNLRDLGLDGAKPLFVQRTVAFRSRLNRGVEIA